jgi:tetratricopeptide (TPR) repeat protein
VKPRSAAPEEQARSSGHWWRRGILLTLAAIAVGVGPAWWMNSAYTRSAAQRLPAVPALADKTESLRRAVQEADRLARAEPASARRVGELGLLYHANHIYEPAGQCYLLAVDLEPDNHQWPYYLACLRETCGISDSVEQLLRRVVELSPEFTPARLRLADGLLKRGDLAAAQLEYERYVQLSRESPYGLLGLARVAMARTDWPGARKWLEQAVAADRTFGPAHRLLSTIYERLGMKEPAQEAQARGSACSRFRPAPEPLLDRLDDLCYDPLYLLVRANAVKQAFDVNRGMALLKRAVEVAPESSQAHAELGQALRERGELAEARRHLDRALQLDPANAEAHTGLGFLLGLQNDLAGAERCIQEALRHKPADVNILYGLGKILYERGAREQATAKFLQAAELSDCRFDDAVESYVTCLVQAGGHELAISFLQLVLAPRPTADRPRLLLARVHVHRGDPLRAVAVLREGLTVAPYNAPVAHGVATLLAALPDASSDQLQEALVNARRAVDFAKPMDLPEHLDTLAIAQARIGDFTAAMHSETEAIQRAEHMRQEARLPELRAHLAEFQAGRAVVRPIRIGSSGGTSYDSPTEGQAGT